MNQTCEDTACLKVATHTITVAVSGEVSNTSRLCRDHEAEAKIAVVEARLPHLHALVPRPTPAATMYVTAKCGQCGHFVADGSAPLEKREPCPECGSKIRAFDGSGSDHTAILDYVSTTRKNNADGFKLTTGDSYTNRSGTWGKYTLKMEKATNTYFEEIVLTDGTVITSVANRDEHTEVRRRSR